jgi:nicotinate-nucleotide adenylyltransferase
MKICLGGSFNPIHHGHLICARAVAEHMGADGIVLIPTAQSPHKTVGELAPVADRMRMCLLAVQGIDMFEVDDREIRRGERSYTIDTVRELRAAGWDRVRWIIGADMLNILPTWKEPLALLAEAEFLVMARPGWTFDWAGLPAEYQTLRKNVVEVPGIDISSTDIRRRCAADKSIDFLTPASVARYIVDRNLYRDGSRA